MTMKNTPMTTRAARGLQMLRHRNARQKTSHGMVCSIPISSVSTGISFAHVRGGDQGSKDHDDDDKVTTAPTGPQPPGAGRTGRVSR